MLRYVKKKKQNPKQIKKELTRVKVSWRQCSTKHVAVTAIQQFRLRLTAFQKVSKV